MVPLFLGAVRRADDMAIALESKGFRSGRKRTPYRQYEFGAWDAVSLFVMVALTTAVFWVKASGYGRV